MQLTHVAVVFNPQGGSARASNLDKLIALLKRDGVKVTKLPTTAHPTSAHDLSKQAASESSQAQPLDLVVVVGGDGTVRLASKGLQGTGIPLSVFPGGTGNLFARSFFAVPEPQAFVNMLKNGNPQPIDAISFSCTDTQGIKHSDFCIIGLGMGDFSAAIATSDQKLKRRFGSLIYAINMAKQAASFTPLSVTLTAHGQSRTETLADAFVLNVTPPKMAALSRGCNASDGLMDFVGIRGKKLSDLLSAGKSILTGRPDRSEQYLRLRVPKLSIKSKQPMLLDLDGDIGPTTTEVALAVIPGFAQMVLA